MSACRIVRVAGFGGMARRGGPRAVPGAATLTPVTRRRAGRPGAGVAPSWTTGPRSLISGRDPGRSRRAVPASLRGPGRASPASFLGSTPPSMTSTRTAPTATLESLLAESDREPAELAAALRAAREARELDPATTRHLERLE